MKSSDKSKRFYLHYHNGYGHKIYHGRDIIWRVSTHKFTWPLFEVVLWGHVTKWIQYISIYRWPKDTKLSKVLTYHERLSSLKKHDPLTKWPTWGHMTTLKNNFFTFTRLIATKLGRVLPHRKRFSTQIL